MGTRHLIAVMKDGQYMLAQYGQWDGYPSGQGIGILDYLTKMNREKFTNGLGRLFEPTQEQLTTWWRAVGHTNYNKPGSDGFVDWNIAKKFNAAHPSLSRDTGADILSMIENSKDPLPTYNSINFAGDSLFCEFAYVIDLDKNTFEIFKGYNSTPLMEGERFRDAPLDEVHGKVSYYRPVKHVKTYSLSELPTKDQFLVELEPGDEEEHDTNEAT